ncbi:MAG: hypothetical protein NC299_16360 [Lachnospiraceae bacterium]|nr:hypothetical protein [Ruminococcus sp.]MCM1276909.1 hypothetical protein [Lachnospiraceae bacterium]
MDTKNESQYRNTFMSIMRDLSKLQDLGEKTDDGKKLRFDYFKKLQDLYSSNDKQTGNFRHYDTDIWAVINEINEPESEGTIDILGQNLLILVKGYNREKAENDIYDKLLDLNDRVSFQISLLASSQTDAIKQLNEAFYTTHEEIHDSQNKLDASRKELDEMRGAMESAQKEYIAILGIFAAIILAFISNITFSTSVLQNMHQASIYRVLLIVVLIGFVLVNTLFILFKFIQELTRARAENSISIKFPIIFNAVVVLMLLAIVLSWYFGAVEHRNEMQSSSESVIENVSSYSVENDKETLLN